MASRCGFVYQYEELQNLYKKYEDKDFIVLGFPSRDFMYQEYSDESKVKEFCSTEYGVTFPMFATSPVKVSKENIANKTEVSIGLRNKGNLQVLSGLDEGDIIVSEGLKKVRPKGKIKPINK